MGDSLRSACAWALFAMAALGADPAGAGDPGAAQPASAIREPATGMELVWVPGGCFPMGDVFGDGDDEERPVHEVCLDGFYLGKYEVTQAQWMAVMGSNPSRDAGCRGVPTCPVDSVSWSDAREFAARLGEGSGGGRYRLPTEAEWEFAARSGGMPERFAGGNDLESVAWFNLNSGRTNHPVGERLPNGLGIHDMSGNVWEWTADWYDGGYYARSPRWNPTGPGQPVGPNVDHVIRGGCKTGEASNARSSHRSYGYQRASGDRADKIGFRVVREP